MKTQYGKAATESGRDALLRVPRLAPEGRKSEVGGRRPPSSVLRSPSSVLRSPLRRFFAVLSTITVSCALAQPGPTDVLSRDFPHAVPYELGDAVFAPGDNITIQQVRGTSETIAIGGTYWVEGTYSLSSRDEADLAFYSTTLSDSGPTPVDSRQHVRIKKGSGSFHLMKTLKEDGYLHLSFYPVSSGSDFGGVYFGQGNRVLRNKRFSQTDHPGNGGAPSVSLSGPNQVLLEYLGSPVEPAANMDARYTKGGLSSAIQLAARGAGISLKKVAIDDSEFPFLVGVTCGESDFLKLTEQIKKMDGYEYNGGTGSHTCNAFSIVPYRAYPPEASQHIHHRLVLRQQVFYDKLSAQK